MRQHPERAWHLQGATNFRDLGGYVGFEGRSVRWGRLFRSDHLAALTGADRARLAQLPLALSFDFRGVEERAATPYDLPGLKQLSLAIEPTVTQRMKDMAEAGKQLTPTLVGELMKDLYRSLVGERAHRFAEFFEHVLQADAALVFHCTAGKDRTGIAAALLLLALGVPRSVVKEDFLLTNALYKHPPVVGSETPPETLAVLWSVQAGFLDAALLLIDTQLGGIERYLADRMQLCGSARAELRERYLVAA